MLLEQIIMMLLLFDVVEGLKLVDLIDQLRADSLELQLLINHDLPDILQHLVQVCLILRWLDLWLSSMILESERVRLNDWLFVWSIDLQVTSELGQFDIGYICLLVVFDILAKVSLVILSRLDGMVEKVKAARIAIDQSRDCLDLLFWND